MLEEQFIPYAEALALKELGFDEKCFGIFINGRWEPRYKSKNSRFKPTKKLDKTTSDIFCTSPLYQQALEWFATEHGLYYNIGPEFYTNGINFIWQILWYLPKEQWREYRIYGGTMSYGDNAEYPTHRKAELGCILKMIEIVKQKRK